MGKISKALRKWRNRQKPGAIMSPEEFKKIEAGAAKSSKVSDPSKVAGSIYWGRVRKRQKGPKEKK